MLLAAGEVEDMEDLALVADATFSKAYPLGDDLTPEPLRFAVSWPPVMGRGEQPDTAEGLPIFEAGY